MLLMKGVHVCGVYVCGGYVHGVFLQRFCNGDHVDRVRALTATRFGPGGKIEEVKIEGTSWGGQGLGRCVCVWVCLGGKSLMARKAARVTNASRLRPLPLAPAVAFIRRLESSTRLNSCTIATTGHPVGAEGFRILCPRPSRHAMQNNDAQIRWHT